MNFDYWLEVHKETLESLFKGYKAEVMVTATFEEFCKFLFSQTIHVEE